MSSDGAQLKGVDESNALVLPASRSKKKKEISKPVSTKKLLTKKQKKELQKVLERKEKKAQVGEYLRNSNSPRYATGRSSRIVLKLIL